MYSIPVPPPAPPIPMVPGYHWSLYRITYELRDGFPHIAGIDPVGSGVCDRRDLVRDGAMHALGLASPMQRSRYAWRDEGDQWLLSRRGEVVPVYAIAIEHHAPYRTGYSLHPVKGVTEHEGREDAILDSRPALRGQSADVRAGLHLVFDLVGPMGTRAVPGGVWLTAPGAARPSWYLRMWPVPDAEDASTPTTAFYTALSEMQRALNDGTLTDVERAWGRAFLALDQVLPAHVGPLPQRKSLPARWLISTDLGNALHYARVGNAEKARDLISSARRRFADAFYPRPTPA